MKNKYNQIKEQERAQQMLAAIDAPKSKSVTIAFLGLKSMILGILLTLTFKQLESHQCSDILAQLSVVFNLFFIMGSLLDLFLMFYFIFTEPFNRLEYYILFGFHLIMAGFALIVSLLQTSNTNDCSLKGQFLGGTLALSIIFIVNAIFVMWCNMYFALKFGNLGSNIVWTFMWFQCLYCGNIFVAIIGVIHAALSIIGLLSFVISNFLGKNTTTAKFWRLMYVSSIVLMIVCYIISFLGYFQQEKCISARFFMLTYQKYGAIQLLAPILLLIFMRTQMGDPREKLIKSQAKIFNRSKENQKFSIDDIN